MESTSENNKLDALTGLRFFAAFAVFYQHLLAITRSKPLVELPYGALAVSFFFVLSGFILTYAYNNRLKGNVGKFYFARIARIWPLHISCLLLMYLALPHKFSGIDTAGEWLKLGLHGTLLQSWVPNNQWAFGFNGVAWSISTEMFFYLMFPLLLLAGPKRFWKLYLGISAATVGAIVGVGMLKANGSLPQFVQVNALLQYFPPLRLFDFATGIAAGFLFLGWKKRGFKYYLPVFRSTFAETAVLFAACSFLFAFREYGAYQYTARMSRTLSFSVTYSGGAWIFALLIFVFANSKGLWSKILGSKLFIVLGNASFAFYLCHSLVLKFVMGSFWAGSLHNFYSIGLFSSLIAIGLSILLFYFVEIPVKNALLNLYSRKPLKSALTALNAPFKTRESIQLAIVSIVLLMGCFAMLRQERTAPEIEDIAAVTPSNYSEIPFGSDLTMVGYKVTPCNKGSLISIAWRRTSDRPFRRIVGFLAANQKEMFRNVDKHFGNAGRWKKGEMVETFFVSDRCLKKSRIITVGVLERGVGYQIAQHDDQLNRGRQLVLQRRHEVAGYQSTAAGVSPPAPPAPLP